MIVIRESVQWMRRRWRVWAQKPLWRQQLNLSRAYRITFYTERLTEIYPSRCLPSIMNRVKFSIFHITHGEKDNKRSLSYFIFMFWQKILNNFFLLDYFRKIWRYPFYRDYFAKNDYVLSFPKTWFSQKQIQSNGYITIYSKNIFKFLLKRL